MVGEHKVMSSGGVYVCTQSGSTDRAYNARCLSARVRGRDARRGDGRGSWPGPV